MSSLRKVPQLSFKSMTSGTAQDRQNFIDNFYRGLKEYGFVVIKDHPLSQPLIDKAYAYSRKLFALSPEEKKQYDGSEFGGQRGLTAFGTEHAKDSTAPDLKEFYHVGRENFRPTASAEIEKKQQLCRNIWPEEKGEMIGFKETFLQIYDALEEMGVTLFRTIALALGEKPDAFESMVDNGDSILRLIHYPPIKGDFPEGSVRSAAHTDINLMTILMGATSEGLELLDRDGKWLPVEAGHSDLVVDSGDTLSRLSNEVIPSTVHRVVNPKDPTQERYSMPFFFHANKSAVLKCLDSCRGEKELYPEITAGDFVLQRLKDIGLY